MDRKDGSRQSTAEPAPGAAIVETATASALALFPTAVTQHQAGNLAEAERLYQLVLARAPDHLDSLHNLGLVALQRGQPEAAAALIAQAIAQNADVPEFHYNLALALHRLGRSSDAADALGRAIALRADYPAAHLNLGNIRREQGLLAEAVASYQHALDRAPNFAEARFNLANVLAEQGRWDTATAAYRQVLAAHPNHADSHHNLGAAYLAQGKNSDAIAHFQRALALNPNLVDAYRHLGQAHIAAGQFPEALAAARRGLEVGETDAGRQFFAQCARFVRFPADDGGFRRWLLRAISESWARPSDLIRVGVSLVMLSSTVSDAVARAGAAWPARLPEPELFGPPGVAGLASDELLRGMMEAAPLTDIGLERLLTNVRAILLSRAESNLTVPDETQFAFWCALARQCFINQYCYAVSGEEAERAARLRDALAAALGAGRPVPLLWPVAVGAYCPLHALPNPSALHASTWPAGVDELIAQQVTQPAHEREYRAAIPALTGIGDGVSGEVRRQYEEDPYPRWMKSGPAIQPVVFNGLPPGHKLEILIAGCGTGQYAIEFARHARDARFLAVDLSVSSLCYAKRMADGLGLDNIEFAQADIMRLDGLGRTFDMIEAGGVLHHLADPWQGWRILLSLLRPGGVKQVGLYSALARRNVAAARSLIAERGYQAIPDDIRRCREDMMAAADGTPLKSLTLWQDFFTTPECRDLLFHPQEHCLTLPEIKTFLVANDLHFAGFVLDAPIEQQFSARFPGRAMLTDLDRWHTYETENPGTFASMYQFWVQKPGADGVTAKLQ